MKKSLWNYASSKPKKPEPTPQEQTNQSPPPNNFEEQIKHFQSMPRDELLSTFYAEIAKQKQNGSFNLKKLENTLASLDAFLSPEQKENIKELLSKI